MGVSFEGSSRLYMQPMYIYRCIPGKSSRRQSLTRISVIGRRTSDLLCLYAFFQHGADTTSVLHSAASLARALPRNSAPFSILPNRVAGFYVTARILYQYIGTTGYVLLRLVAGKIHRMYIYVYIHRTDLSFTCPLYTSLYTWFRGDWIDDGIYSYASSWAVPLMRLYHWVFCHYGSNGFAA